MQWIKRIAERLFEKLTSKDKLVLVPEEISDQIVENSSKLSDYVKKEEIVFDSPNIASISSVGEILDASNQLNVAKYKNNLKLLIEKAKNDGKIDKFMLIRNDDFFPYDWKWRVSSKNTGMELSGLNLTYNLRNEIAMYNTGMTRGLDLEKSIFYDLMIPNEKIKEQLNLLDKDLGKIYTPCPFRSTKHFTVNTPLSYTGDYNWVDTDRTFTVMDSMDEFLNTGYAYSASYKDAYTDITHEPLSISENAIVFISEDKYPNVVKDMKIAKMLETRRVIVYKGDIATAINMVLTEMGILPYRPGNHYVIYDKEILELLENSLEDFCHKNNIAYNQGHGNIDGKGGHFTDNYDRLNRDVYYYEKVFLDYLKEKLPDCKDVICPIILKEESAFSKAIKVIGADRLLKTIQEYNLDAKKELSFRYQQYLEDRASITPEISEIFKVTAKAIDTFYRENKNASISNEEEELIKVFFQADKVQDQLFAATMLCQKWGISLEQKMTPTVKI